jgi:hypothetical protein
MKITILLKCYMSLNITPKSTDASEKHVASIIRVEEQDKQALLHADFSLVLFFDPEDGSYVLPKTSPEFRPTAWPCIPDDNHICSPWYTTYVACILHMMARFFRNIVTFDLRALSRTKLCLHMDSCWNVRDSDGPL